jgi:hypothetical protein
MNPLALCAALAVLLATSPGQAQSGGSYDLSRNTIDGGGATVSAGGAYALGGTIGQPDAGTMSGDGFRLDGGFWSAVSVVPPATATPTRTATRSRTPTHTASFTPTRTATATASPPPGPFETPTATRTPTGSGTSIATTTATQTRTPSASPTPSPTPIAGLACPGDCNDDRSVTIDELIRGVAIALEQVEVTTCTAFDINNDGSVTIDELVTGVTNALTGCPTGAAAIRDDPGATFDD